jgi:general secretion pathway protein D
VVVAPPHEWNIISDSDQLDIMPRQVLNEVLIAEVRLTDDLKYGIEFLRHVPFKQTSTGPDELQSPPGVVVNPTTTTTGPGTTATAPTPPGWSRFRAEFTLRGFTFSPGHPNKLKGLINLLPRAR